MSYDIRIGAKIEGLEKIIPIGRPKLDSPTYNLRDMFVACMDWNYTQGEWYKVSDIWSKVEKGISELRMHEKKYFKYNPSSGWGDTKSALRVLTSLSECFRRRTSEDEYGDDAIPLEHLYMRW